MIDEQGGAAAGLYRGYSPGSGRPSLLIKRFFGSSNASSSFDYLNRSASRLCLCAAARLGPSPGTRSVSATVGASKPEPARAIRVDISFVDQSDGTYYLADLTNEAVDAFFVEPIVKQLVPNNGFAPFANSTTTANVNGQVERKWQNEIRHQGAISIRSRASRAATCGITRSGPTNSYD